LTSSTRLCSGSSANVVAEVIGPDETFRAGREKVPIRPRVHNIGVRGAIPRRTHLVKLWGLALPEQIVRCDVRRIRVR
jgi:hypothetical protein